MSRDAPYPELKKTHTMAHVGRPFRDYKPPAAAPVWAVIEGFGRYHILVAALELGVFEALAEPPQAHKAAAVARRLAVSAPHLEALLDSICAMGLADQTNPAGRHGEQATGIGAAAASWTGGATRQRAEAAPTQKAQQAEQTQRAEQARQAQQARQAPAAAGTRDTTAGLYRLNDTARRYLLVDGSASMAGLVGVAPGPYDNWRHLAHTVRHGQPPAPIDGHRSDPAGFYRPLVEGTFTTVWRSATRADLQLRYSAMNAPAVLDLGAGGAPWSIAVLEACPAARATVNDLPGVIGFAKAKTAEHGVAGRCEFRPGDFHTVAIDPGSYDLVVLGHVCRTEGPSGARHLIGRAFQALRPEGRIVLSDYFVGPESKHSPHAVLMGMTMMANTVSGFPVTTRAATSWLRDAGFEAIRLIEPIGYQFVYVASKPRP